jgi:hypothetical protein
MMFRKAKTLSLKTNNSVTATPLTCFRTYKLVAGLNTYRRKTAIKNNINNLATQTVSFSSTRTFGLDSEPIHIFIIKIHFNITVIVLTIKSHLNVINIVSVFQP